MNKTIIAGLSALVLSSCVDYKPTNEVVNKGSFEVPRECAKIISLSYDRHLKGWEVLCDTSSGKEVLFNRYRPSDPWQRYEIERK